ncbi:MAG TPA: transposase [Paludibacteraceae bacterium]|nr:transposase [Paludibacteraceae bacterium]
MIGFGEGTGITFFDFTLIKICNNKRIQCKLVFKDMTKLIKSMLEDFFGFKLPLNGNEKRNLLNFALTKDNVDDRNPDIILVLYKDLFEKLCADKGYIAQKFFDIF